MLRRQYTWGTLQGIVFKGIGTDVDCSCNLSPDRKIYMIDYDKSITYKGVNYYYTRLV